MDLIIADPFVTSMGGGTRVLLEMCKRFNPIVYSVVYDKDASFKELSEFDIRILPKSKLERPFELLRNDRRYFNATAAGFRYYFTKVRYDYDVIGAFGSPSEWIRNRNPRVAWFCYSPNRQAYDLYEFRKREMSFGKRLLNDGLLGVFNAVEQTTVPRLEHIMTSSEVVKARIRKYLHRDDATVVAPGVDCKEFTNAGYNRFFFYPSRIVPEKRFEIAIDAFREFSKTHKGWKLVIGGFLSSLARDQLYYKNLIERAKGLDVEFRLNLAEQELKRLYSECYAVLFCAVDEDFGLIPLEAMASEKPIISINEGGPRFTILDGKTGFLVSADGFCRAMCVLADDVWVAEGMGKNGREHVQANYTWKQFLDGVEKSLRKVAK